MNDLIANGIMDITSLWKGTDPDNVSKLNIPLTLGA